MTSSSNSSQSTPPSAMGRITPVSALGRISRLF